jgi:hypothetical protein
MHEDILDNLGGLVRHLLERAREDADLRQRLRAVARAVLDVVEEAEAAERRAEEERAAGATPAPPPEHLAPQKLEELAASLAESALRITDEPPAPEPAPAAVWQAQPVGNDELARVAARCALKAEAARWALDRVERMERGADYELEITPKDRELISKAKSLPDCYLWMSHPSGPSPNRAAAARWDELAEAFDNVARMAALLQDVLAHREESPDHFEHALELAAEAQSALRVAAREVGFEAADADQEKFFLWLRRVAYEEQVYLQRYMRVTDKANPAAYAQLQNRIEELDADFQSGRQQGKLRQQLLQKARYHVKMIERSPGANHAGDWSKVVSAMEGLLELGMPPSSVDLRNILLPVLDDLPDLAGDHPGFDLVLREIDAYISVNPVQSRVRTEAAPSEEVQQAAALLRGRTIVMIGGEPRTEAKSALEKALGLEELLWVTSSKHQSIETFEPVIARPDVALVLLAIRWSSHSFGDVRNYCEQYGKPLVRLPAGYNANQVAAQILAQASGHLEDGSG